MISRKKPLFKKLMAIILAAVMLVSANIGTLNVFAASGLLKPMMIVNMTEKTGDILHGASGFLYGISNENVPTVNTLTPLKPKVLATKGALGTEHPYGDALDVAETFIEAGGEQVQMYNSNYYAVFGPTAHPEDYANVLENIIAPKVREWEEEDPEYRKGKLVYVPINEGTPVGYGYNFNQAFKLYYDAIKRAHPDALVAGPNDANFSSNTIYNFLVYAKNNNCVPDVITWHELDNSDIPNIYNNVQRVRNWMKELNIPERKIVINEYAPAVDCGVPGKLVNWIARLEDAKVYGCLPFWHQANNLNDLAADANVGNGAWWVYKWYGDMSGQTLKVETKNTTYDGLYGLASIDDHKKVSNVIFGGVDGEAKIILDKIDQTIPFNSANKVHVKIEAAYFSGYHGAVNEPDTILEGIYPVRNGRLIIDMKDMTFSTAYNITITPAGEDEEVDNPRIGKFRAVYEAEKAELLGNASVAGMGWYYASGKQYVTNINNDGDGLVYTINVPTDGKYKLEFVYGNGVGANSQSETLHNPLNLTQTLSIDGKEPIVMHMKSTLLPEMTGIHTEYVDLTAGEHTLTIKKHGERGGVNHDVLYVTYAGAYQQPVPEFNKKYEAEHANFNALGETKQTSVTIENELTGYSNDGYVTGLNESPVENGGGIRWIVVVEESGLYDISLRYQSTTEGEARIYLDNTNLTFNNLCTTVPIVNTNGQWKDTRATIYLQKGINIIDLDTSVNAAVDYMRVRKARGLEDYTITVEAEDAELHGTEVVESPYASNGKYIKGLEGDANAIENGKYIEFKVNADEAGPYRMQIFFSNKDIFGTHAYNLKIIDKYASIQVNDQEPKRYFFINTFSNDTFKEKTITVYLEQGENTIKIFNDDSWQVTKGDRKDQPGDIPLDNYSPNFDKFQFTPAVVDVPTTTEKIVYYFVDAGDHDPTTVTEGYELGIYNSVTEQAYGEDPVTGKMWGIVDEPVEEPTPPNSNGVFTKYTWPNEHQIADNQNPVESFRYARGQDVAFPNLADRPGILYEFELPDGEYDVEVGMYTPWQRWNTEVYFNRGTENEVLAMENTRISTNINNPTILRAKAAAHDGKLNINIRMAPRTSGGNDATTAVSYIIISKEVEVLPVEDYKVDIYTSAGGTAIANKNVVEPGGSVELTIVPEKGIKDVLVNDESFKDSLIDNQDGSYTLIIPNVQSDIEVFVNFESVSGDAIEENEDIYIKNSSFGTGDTSDWEIETEGVNAIVEDSIKNLAAGNYYLKLSGEEDWKATISQHLNNVPDGRYILSVYSKNVNSDIPDAKPGEANEFYLFADNGQRIFKENIGIFEQYTQTSVWVEVTGGELTVGVSVDAKAGLDVYLDHFALIPAPVDESIAYFVNAGDIDPKTINEGDKFGIYNSVTDQFYGPDKFTGMKWGVVDQYVPRSNYPGYLTGQYTWPAENIGATDSSPKEETYRYARDQHTMDRISRPGVQYKFELPNGKYSVEIGMQNSWQSYWNVDVWFYWGTEKEERIASNIRLPYGRTASTIAKVIREVEVENGELSIRVNGVQQDAPGVVNYIIIKPLNVEKTLERIEVTPPIKTVYTVGEVFDATGMSVRAIYSDGSSEIVTDYTMSGFDSETPGEKTIIVTYRGKTTTFKVNVFPVTSDRSFTIISDGKLDRTDGLLAVITVAPVQGGPAHDGTEVILFQLMRGNTPVSIVAVEKDIIAEETLRAYFNVDPDDDSYKVRVYVLDSFTTDLTSAPVSLAEWITLQ